MDPYTPLPRVPIGLVMIVALLFRGLAAYAGEDLPKPRVAVLDFTVRGKVDETGGPVLAAVVRREFQRSGRVDLMDRAMMRERMNEKDFAATAECNQIRCMLQYGKSLEVHKIVGGRGRGHGHPQ